MPSTSILGIKPGHDGALALLKDGELVFALEAEKDNGPRFGSLQTATWIKGMELCPSPPDVIANGGWSDGASPFGKPIHSGYLGVDALTTGSARIWGRPVRTFSSSHERSHLLCAYGLSPWEQGRPCYALVWEGYIGSLYFIDEHVGIAKLGNVLDFPGMRFAFLFGLADPSFDLGPGMIRLSDAGKLMALTGFASPGVAVCDEGADLVRRLLSPTLSMADLDKTAFQSSAFHDCGVTNERLVAVAKHLSDRLFQSFEQAALEHCKQPHPLLIAGGCALNCEWNSRWAQSELFTDLFVPPCANDSGSAIGTAIDAQLHLHGTAKVSWSVYAGEEPVDDGIADDEWAVQPYTAQVAAALLAKGNILGWMRGRYEIGPRALGARSILASPLDAGMLAKLNRIKQREEYRPIAPACREEDMERWFEGQARSPYMLQFRRVTSDRIPAATHVDGSARPQSVNHNELPELHALLTAFCAITDVPVLCNTSLNFKGAGFINRLSDLSRFVKTRGLDGFVFEDRLYLRRTLP